MVPSCSSRRDESEYIYFYIPPIPWGATFFKLFFKLSFFSGTKKKRKKSELELVFINRGAMAWYMNMYTTYHNLYD